MYQRGDTDNCRLRKNGKHEVVEEQWPQPTEVKGWGGRGPSRKGKWKEKIEVNGDIHLKDQNERQKN
ncbi:hypothetical protein Tco_1212788 [Tanacetum coccineum]